MSGPPPKKPPRPWYRLHASTWVVMVLALAAMTFWNAAGYYYDPEQRSVGEELWTHGWPLTYLTSNVQARRQSRRWEWEPNWREGFAWRMDERIVQCGLGRLS
jgi:hypothetical protein